MRKLLVFVLIVALLVAVGWISFRYDGRQAAVSFNTEAARQDTHELAEKGREAVERATDRGREMINETKSADAVPSSAPAGE